MHRFHANLSLQACVLGAAAMGAPALCQNILGSPAPQYTQARRPLRISYDFAAASPAGSGDGLRGLGEHVPMLRARARSRRRRPRHDDDLAEAARSPSSLAQSTPDNC